MNTTQKDKNSDTFFDYAEQRGLCTLDISCMKESIGTYTHKHTQQNPQKYWKRFTNTVFSIAVNLILHVQKPELTYQTICKKVTTAQTVLAADNWY